MALPEIKVTVSADTKTAQGNLAALGAEFDRFTAAEKKSETQGKSTDDQLKKTSRAFEMLRSSVDDTYASSKRYEAALKTTMTAVKAGTVSHSEANRVLELAKQKYLLTGQAAQTMGGQIKTANAHTTNLMFQFQDIGMMLAAGQNPLMLAMQQGTQVAGVFHQMKGAGLSAFSGIKAGLSALVSPMALVTVGVIAGGAALIQWAASAVSAGEEAKTWKERLSDLDGAINEYSSAVQNSILTTQELAEKYGMLASSMRETFDTISQIAKEKALVELSEKATMAANSLADITNKVTAEGDFLRASDAFMMLVEKFGIGADEASRLNTEMNRLSRAEGPREIVIASNDLIASLTEVFGHYRNMPPEIRKQVDALSDVAARAGDLAEDMKTAADNTDTLYGKIMSAVNGMAALTDAAPKRGWLGGAIADADTLAAKLWSAAKAKAAIAQKAAGIDKGLIEQYRQYGAGRAAAGSALQTADPLYGGTGSILTTLNPPKEGGGGGGRGGGGSRNFDALIKSLQTQSEIVNAWYEDSLEQLNKATDAELAAIGGKNEAKLRLEEEYQKRLSEIRDKEKYATLQGYGDMFGALAQVFQAGGEKNLGIAKAFGAAQAAVSMWVGAAKALELPFPQNLAAWAKVLATGAQAIQGIRGVTSNGSTGGGSSAASSANAGPAAQAGVANLTFIGTQSAGDMRNVVEQINELTKQGYRINARAIAS